MRVAKLQVRIGMFATLALLAVSCQSAHKPAPILPPASAPPLTARTQEPTLVSQSVPVPVPVAAPEPAQPPAPDTEKAAAPDSAPAQASPTDVGDLLMRVENEYQSGMQAYHAGQKDAAKEHFDRAFNALLDSNLDIRSDDRLEQEFDRIVDGINQLDIGGLAADSEAQSDAQKSEPAPIDETNEIAPSADARVKAKAQAEIKHTRSDLPLMMTDQVAGYISYFSNRGRGTFERAFARSGRYRELMLPILKQEGVPQDLIYLAQAESGFHPLAVSRVGARGIWQFMASRARGYGLQRDWWVDDRQDPEKSTRAAARHLKDLYQQFGDWYLAMAAYNSGPGTVQSAVKRTGYADFWELYHRNVLPKETRNYVPIIVAVTIMAKNPGQYGLDHLEKEKAAPFDSVTIDYPVDLRLVAECVDASAADLQDLNPSLLRLTTPKDHPFQLHLPAGTKDKFEAAIAAVPPDMRVWWRYHKVQAGETLASLARTYRTTSKAIAEANNLEDGQELTPDSKLTIPIAPGKHASTEDTAAYAHRLTRYKVRKGDTVQTVADNFGVPPIMVRKWNHLKGNSLAGRRIVYVHLPITPNASKEEFASAAPKSSPSKSKTKKIVATATSGTTSVVHHRVKQGETLYSIASNYKTTVDALKRDNSNVAVLRPGMVLIIKGLP